MQTIPFTELRDRLAETIRTVEATQEPLILSRRGKPKAVLMSYAQFQRLTAATDSLIAAIALAHSLTLVTHNTRDFAGIADLKIEDWFGAASNVTTDLGRQ